MKDFTFVVFFTSGRTGTAYLSQVFGFHEWKRAEKGRLNVVQGKYLTSHETGWDMRTPHLKKIGFTCDEAKRIQKQFFDRVYAEVKSKYSSVQKYMMTDLMTGRYYSHGLPGSGYDYRVIFLHRKKGDLIKSYIRHGIGRSKRDIRTNPAWTTILNAPIDHDVINPIPLEVFNNMEIEEKLDWFHKEFHDQWKALTKIIPQDKRMEIPFEDIIGENALMGLDKISRFVEMPYSKELVKVRVNSDRR